jgi:hypothetical protein
LVTSSDKAENRRYIVRAYYECTLKLVPLFICELDEVLYSVVCEERFCLGNK